MAARDLKAGAAPPAAARKAVLYTFGNHMHWVDMEWLWGYGVLPGSVRDILRLCREGGVRGNVNFDAVGYERMAAECPEALGELREAIAAGVVEVVGGSYGQPYGLFQGGESNVRQRVFGVRACLRLLSVRPRAFWEEEFDFFPQLPQILRGCGYESACLFFQWTWHTPELPLEPHALIQWEGLDGTRLPALPRNELNLHQWPEDFEPLFRSALLRELGKPAIVQWVELMPSPDWMCRSELLLPKLRELQADPRYEIQPATISQVVRALDDGATPVRRYTLDDAWHGVTLGKNGDAVPRLSRRCERQLLAAESAAALAGLFGRPYPSWDVYPAWELEEAWRELLAAQHHDNHECEGLCGAIGKDGFERSARMSERVFERTVRHIARHVAAPAGATVVFNPMGWTEDVRFGTEGRIARGVPPFGYRVIGPRGEGSEPGPAVALRGLPESFELEAAGVRAAVDRGTGLVTRLESAHFSQGPLRADRPFGRLEATRKGALRSYDGLRALETGFEEGGPVVRATRGSGDHQLQVSWSLDALASALCLRITTGTIPSPRPDPGMHAGLQLPVVPSFAPFTLVHDHPYGVGTVRADGSFRRKYPTGDWMTSPQWFETIRRPFTASSFVDILDSSGERGLLVVHDGSQCFFRDEEGVRLLLCAYDPWDEAYFDGELDAHVWLVPHGPLTHSERVRMAAGLAGKTEASLWERKREPGGHQPEEFGSLLVEPSHVLATALYRESERAGEHLPEWAGRGMGFPYVARLVEYDGIPAGVTLRLPGAVARAARTNLLGELLEELRPEPAAAPFGPPDLHWSALQLRMRPHEIATVMADLELGRKQARDLDRYRSVWATVHRTSS